MFRDSGSMRSRLNIPTFNVRLEPEVSHEHPITIQPFISNETKSDKYMILKVVDGSSTVIQSQLKSSAWPHIQGVKNTSQKSTEWIFFYMRIRQTTAEDFSKSLKMESNTTSSLHQFITVFPVSAVITWDASRCRWWSNINTVSSRRPSDIVSHFMNRLNGPMNGVKKTHSQTALTIF